MLVIKLFYVLSFLAGLIFGSFGNAWAYRFVRGVSVCRGRSVCPECSRTLSWYANIPLISYLFLRGRCAFCNKPIAFRYPLAEFVLGVWFVAVMWKFGLSLETPFYWGVGFFFLLLSLIDLERFILPDTFVFGLTLWVFGVGSFVGLPFREMILGACVGAGGLWSVAILYRVLRKRDGLGFGDVKLMFPIGALCGVYGLPMVLLTSSSSGIVFFLITFLFSKKFSVSAKIPFGPFLCFGAALYLLWGAKLYSIFWLM